MLSLYHQFLDALRGAWGPAAIGVMCVVAVVSIHAAVRAAAPPQLQAVQQLSRRTLVRGLAFVSPAGFIAGFILGVRAPLALTAVSGVLAVATLIWAWVERTQRDRRAAAGDGPGPRTPIGHLLLIGLPSGVVITSGIYSPSAGASLLAEFATGHPDADFAFWLAKAGNVLLALVGWLFLRRKVAGSRDPRNVSALMALAASANLLVFATLGGGNPEVAFVCVLVGGAFCFVPAYMVVTLARDERGTMAGAIYGTAWALVLGLGYFGTGPLMREFGVGPYVLAEVALLVVAAPLLRLAPRPASRELAQADEERGTDRVLVRLVFVLSALGGASVIIGYGTVEPVTNHYGETYHAPLATFATLIVGAGIVVAALSQPLFGWLAGRFRHAVIVAAAVITTCGFALGLVPALAGPQTGGLMPALQVVLIEIGTDIHVIILMAILAREVGSRGTAAFFAAKYATAILLVLIADPIAAGIWPNIEMRQTAYATLGVVIGLGYIAASWLVARRMTPVDRKGAEPST